MAGLCGVTAKAVNQPPNPSADREKEGSLMRIILFSIIDPPCSIIFEAEM